MPWTQTRPYPLPSQLQGEVADAANAPACSWDDVAVYVERSGSNAFERTLCTSLAELYGLGEGRITRENWEVLDGEICRRHRDPGWAAAIMSGSTAG
jgi:hypothetical protein